MLARWLKLMAVAWTACLLAAPAAATHIKPQLVAERSAAPNGGTVTLAIVMQPQPGWHGYWQNPGDSGIATQVEWSLPGGASAGALAYPIPTTLVIAGLMNHVYEHDFALLVDLKLPAGLKPGTTMPIRARLDWLACTDAICVPEKGSVSLDLPVGDGAADPAHVADFAKWRAALPKPLDVAAHFEQAGDKVRIGVPLPASLAVQDPHFFAATEDALTYSAAQAATRSGDMLVIETAAHPGAKLAALDGVLRIGADSGLSVHAVPGAVPAGGEPLGGAAAGAGASLLLALGGALLGGLLLNVMPCVFPILSLKALSLARSGGGESEARREALAYTAGVVLVCAALGAALLALRASGSAAGWAFQLQNPSVILVLLLLVSAIGLNLAGLFELPAVTGGDSLADKGGTAGAFWTGALAAFVATPCTGPFMGAALGAALLLPPAGAMAVFVGLGLGLALPFLLLGFVPALRRWLPRPGAWMNVMRRILAVPMLVTALGLAWVLGRQAGVDGMTFGLAATLLVALALWWVGRRQESGLGRAWWPAAPALLAVAALLVLAPPQPAAASAAEATALGSEPFSEARLAALQAEGRPVFVYFTADWCLTCKVNEKAAIERAEVADAFKAKKVAVLVGDWTNGDAGIGGFLSRHGRSGVPLYLWYAPGKDPQVLPQLLTPGTLTALAA